MLKLQPQPVRALRAGVAALGLLLAAAGAHAQGVIEEVPFIVSPDNVTLEMLRIAGVRRGDHVMDLGSGDGRIVILAAKRFGATGLGVEIVPDLVEKSLKSARQAGVADKVDFKVQDLFKTDLAPATVITMYLLQEVNLQLRPGLLQLKPGTRLVSHDWDMGDWAPDQTTTLQVPDKQVGREKLSRVHLWIVPARLQGLWCGQDKARGITVRLNQQYQLAAGSVERKAHRIGMSGRIHGADLRTVDGARLALADSGDLRVKAGGRETALRSGMRFQRGVGDSCPA